MLANRVRELTQTIGTGDIALDGALPAHIAFADAFSVGDTITYVLEDGDNFEIGTGTLSMLNRLERTTISETLVGGLHDKTAPAPISLSGNARVYCAATAEFLQDTRLVADSISEAAPDAGINIEGVLIKGGSINLGGGNALSSLAYSDLMLGNVTGSHGVTIQSSPGGRGGIAFSDGNTTAVASRQGRFDFVHGSDTFEWLTADGVRMSLGANDAELFGRLGIGGAAHSLYQQTVYNNSGYMSRYEADGELGFVTLLSGNLGLWAHGVAGNTVDLMAGDGNGTVVGSFGLGGINLNADTNVFGELTIKSSQATFGPIAGPASGFALDLNGWDGAAIVSNRIVGLGVAGGGLRFDVGGIDGVLQLNSSAAMFAGDLQLNGNITAGFDKSIYVRGAQNVYRGIIPETDMNLMLGTGSGDEPRIYLFGSLNGQTSAGNIFIGTAGNTGQVEMAGSVKVSGAINKGSTSSVLEISGGSGSASSANILLYGGTHATLANDIVLRTGGTTERLRWSDASLSWNFGTNILTGVSDVRGGNATGFTSLSGGTDDVAGANARFYGESHATQPNDIEFRTGTTVRAQWNETAQNWNYKNTILTGVDRVFRGVDTDFLLLSGGPTSDVGANLFLYGASDPGNPGDILFRSSASNVLFYDHSAGQWHFQGAEILGTQLLTGGNATGQLNIAGGSTDVLGARLILRSENHATEANNVIFRHGSTNTLIHLAASNTWDYLQNSVIGVSRLQTGTIAPNNFYANRFTGAFTSGGGDTVVGGTVFSQTITAASGDTSWQAAIAAGAATGAQMRTQGSAETIGVVATAYLTEPGIVVNGGDTITNAATLYVSGQPTEGVNNYAAYFGGDVAIESFNTTALTLRHTDGATVWQRLRNSTSDYYVGYEETQGFILSPDSTAVHLAVNATTGVVTINNNIIYGNDIVSDSNAGAPVFSFGNSNGAGANIKGFGGAHSTNANDFQIRAGSMPWLNYDASAALLTITPDTVFEGNIAVSGTSFVNTDNVSNWTVSGGSGTASGSNITLYGGAHIGQANDFAFRAGASNVLYYDHSAGQWDYQNTSVRGISDLRIDAEGNAANLTIQRTNAGSADSGIGNIEFENNVGTIMSRISSANGTNVSASVLKFWVRNVSEGLVEALEIKENKSAVFAGNVTVSGKVNLGVPTELTIAAGAVTITKTRHTIDGEGDAADQLDTISGGAIGDQLILSIASDARPITFSDSTGNMKLAGNFVADSIYDRITLEWDGTWWCEIGRSNNS